MQESLRARMCVAMLSCCSVNRFADMWAVATRLTSRRGWDGKRIVVGNERRCGVSEKGLGCCSGFSTLEYVILIAFVVMTFVAFMPYIQRAFQGQYRRSGESFAQSRQHDTLRTRDCIWDVMLQDNDHPEGRWYSEKCFDYQEVVLGCATKKADNVMGDVNCSVLARKDVHLNAAVAGCADANIAGNCAATCCVTAAKAACTPECVNFPIPQN